MSTRLCKRGLDWIASQGGTVRALLDGVDTKELVGYRDLMQRKAKQVKKARKAGRPEERLENPADMAKSLETPLGQKVITYSEIRHMLSHWKELGGDKGQIVFYRRGEPLKATDVKNLRLDFETQNLKGATEPKRLFKIIARCADLWDIDIAHLEEFEKLRKSGEQSQQELLKLLQRSPWQAIPIQETLKSLLKE
jgi:hypothetical protein